MGEESVATPGVFRATIPARLVRFMPYPCSGDKYLSRRITDSRGNWASAIIRSKTSTCSGPSYILMSNVVKPASNRSFIFTAVTVSPLDIISSQQSGKTSFVARVNPLHTKRSGNALGDDVGYKVGTNRIGDDKMQQAHNQTKD